MLARKEKRSLIRMSWYKVTFSDDAIAAGRQISLQDDFSVLWITAGVPKDVGMFGRPGPCVRDYYFSLGASETATDLIARYSGVKCTAPARSEVHTLVGHAGAEGIPFSGRSEDAPT
jgi:hypothetical protein